MLTGKEASMDGTTVFERSSRRGGRGWHQGRLVAASGGGAIWRRHQHGDQLGTALRRDWQRQAGPGRRLSAEEDHRPAPRLADATVPEGGFYRARGVGRT